MNKLATAGSARTAKALTGNANTSNSTRIRGNLGKATAGFRPEKGAQLANVADVAKYFLMLAASGEEDAGEAITHLKLQKLLYYAQGFFLAIFDKVLFTDSIQAWKQGPVVPSIWHSYKQMGAASIPAAEDFEPRKVLSDDEQELLNEVWNAYGQFSAWKLRNMTHEEPPWLKAYQADRNAVISEESLRAYFATQVE